MNCTDRLALRWGAYFPAVPADNGLVWGLEGVLALYSAFALRASGSSVYSVTFALFSTFSNSSSLLLPTRPLEPLLESDFTPLFCPPTLLW